MFYVLIASLIAMSSQSAFAQTPLPLNQSIPVDRGMGEASTRLSLSFTKPIAIAASLLSGDRRTRHTGEVQGRLVMKNGTIFPAADLNPNENGTYCNLVVWKGVFFGGRPHSSKAIDANAANLNFNDFELHGSFKVLDVHYQSGMSFESRSGVHSNSSTGDFYQSAVIQLAGNEDPNKLDVASQSVISVIVTKKYRGEVQDPTISEKLKVTPAALKSCFGEDIEILEVPSK